MNRHTLISVKIFAISVLILAAATVLSSVTMFIINPEASISDAIFFKDGRIIQFAKKVDMPPATPSVDDLGAIAAEKEIKAIANCLQSIQPKLSSEIAFIVGRHTYEECNKQSISIPLWIALMFAESSLNPMAVSHSGAIGICQVQYEPWKLRPELTENGVSTKDKLFWIDLNIKCGAAIFKKFYEESNGEIGAALWRYNSGKNELPNNRQPYQIEFVAKVLYYAYKITETLNKRS